MKNFFTVVSIQETLKQCNYQSKGSSKLVMEKTTSFPIIQVINGYAEQGEEISVVAVRDMGEKAAKNSKALEEELKVLSEEKGFTYALKYVDIQEDQDVNTQIDSFQKIIEHTNDNDTLYACLTYGTKPQSKTLEMAINYADKLQFNTYVDCIVYGQVTGNYTDDPRQGEIYDITAQTKLNDIVNSLAERKVKNPAEVLKSIIEL